MSSVRFRASVAVALLTVAAALLLRYESVRHEATGSSSSCSLSPRFDCDAVQASAYSKVLGVSLATWGALAAVVLLAWLLLSRKEPALLVAAGAAVAVSCVAVLYTAAVSWIVLGQICLYCSAMQAGFVALAILVGPAAWRARALLPRRPLLLGGTAAALLLALGLSGEAYAAGQARIGRMQLPSSGRGVRIDVSDAILLGDPRTPVEVVLFFDFGCEYCLECYRSAARMVQGSYGHANCVHYWFKHYPLDRECNGTLPATKHVAACRAALGGQAAQALGLDAKGLEAMFHHQSDGFSKLVMEKVGKELGVPAAQWADLLASPGVKALVDRDIAEGNALGLPYVPFAYVNGRVVDAKRLPESLARLCR